MNKSTSIAAVLVLVAALLVGCNGQSTAVLETRELTEDVTLSITTDYGSELVYESSNAYEEGWTVYDLLLAHVEIETAYGGSFIDAINGIESSMNGADGRRADWFYYVNGICADVGVLDYNLKPGDRVWWDYHGWQGGHSSNSAVTDGFPYVFANGYGKDSRGVYVLYAHGYKEQADELASVFNALDAENTVAALDESVAMLSDRQGPTLVIGDWMSLQAYPYLDNLNSSYEKNGQFMTFTQEGLDLFTPLGEVVQTLESEAGAIMAHGDGLGDKSPLWIVTGMDPEDVDKAAALLTAKNSELKNTYSIVVRGSELIPLPIQE